MLRRCSNRARPRSRPITRSDNWQPRRCGSAGVMISSTCGRRARTSASSMPVSASDLLRSASMPARSNRSSEARNGASPRMGGLLSCHPSAPMAGVNCGAIWKRVVLMAPPASESGQGGVAMVALVHEGAGNRARAAVEVFVMAPHRKVRRHVMQAQRQVAHRMRQVEPMRAPCRRAARVIASRSKAWPVVLHAGPQHQRQARAVLGDGAFDRGQRNRAVGFVRLHFHQTLGRVETMEADLSFHRVAVGQCAGFHQDHRALRGRPVEADHHQMQVHAQRVHRHHFAGQRTDHAGQLRAHQAVVGQPLGRAGEVASTASSPHCFITSCTAA